MHKSEDRVLTRAGAREITEQELESIQGGLHTLVCTISPTTGSHDGDACF
jgi:bacteriocin-like protein